MILSSTMLFIKILFILSYVVWVVCYSQLMSDSPLIPISSLNMFLNVFMSCSWGLTLDSAIIYGLVCYYIASYCSNISSLAMSACVLIFFLNSTPSSYLWILSATALVSSSHFFIIGSFFISVLTSPALVDSMIFTFWFTLIVFPLVGYNPLGLPISLTMFWFSCLRLVAVCNCFVSLSMPGQFFVI